MGDLVKRADLTADKMDAGEFVGASTVLRQCALEMEEAADRIKQLEAQLAKSRVKPLVWEYHPAGTIAAPTTGHAYIIDTRTKNRFYSIKGFQLQREFASLEEAQAAAQADYEARIIAALE
mgnify:CR=1 FL=1